MIFDRTQNDVDTAIRLINEKVKFDSVTLEPLNIEQLTPEELEILEKGTFNAGDINRIENKISELRPLLNGMGYWDTDIKNEHSHLTHFWSTSKIFDTVNFQRIIDNVNVLRNAFFTYNDTPSTPPISYHYEDINSLEKILFDIDVMINDVKSNYRECGNFECGA